MHHITDIGLALIKRFEGFSPTIYICPAGYPTVGYGHVVKPEERSQFAGGISESKAEDVLRRDVYIAEAAVLRLIRVPLIDGQFDALVSFTFNLGTGALQRSTLRRCVNRQASFDAQREFGKWVFVAGRKLPGLVMRRAAESARYYAIQNSMQ